MAKVTKVMVGEALVGTDSVQQARISREASPPAMLSVLRQQKRAAPQRRSRWRDWFPSLPLRRLLRELLRELLELLRELLLL